MPTKFKKLKRLCQYHLTKLSLQENDSSYRCPNEATGLIWIMDPDVQIAQHTDNLDVCNEHQLKINKWAIAENECKREK